MPERIERGDRLPGGELLPGGVHEFDHVPGGFLLPGSRQPDRMQRGQLLSGGLDQPDAMRGGILLSDAHHPNRVHGGELLPGGVHGFDTVRGGILLLDAGQPERVQRGQLLSGGIDRPDAVRGGILLRHARKPSGLYSGQLLPGRFDGSDAVRGGILLPHSGEPGGMPGRKLLPGGSDWRNDVPRRVFRGGECEPLQRLPDGQFLRGGSHGANDLRGGKLQHGLWFDRLPDLSGGILVRGRNRYRTVRTGHLCRYGQRELHGMSGGFLLPGGSGEPDPMPGRKLRLGECVGVPGLSAGDFVPGRRLGAHHMRGGKLQPECGSSLLPAVSGGIFVQRRIESDAVRGRNFRRGRFVELQRVPGGFVLRPGRDGTVILPGRHLLHGRRVRLPGVRCGQLQRGGCEQLFVLRAGNLQQRGGGHLVPDLSAGKLLRGRDCPADAVSGRQLQHG